MSGYGAVPEHNLDRDGDGDRPLFVVGLRYPRTDGNCRTVEVGLEDVRAADPIRIQYDFDRDGWVVLQERLVEMMEGVSAGTGRWVEVAFVQAWGQEVSEREADPEDIEATGWYQEESDG